MAGWMIELDDLPGARALLEDVLPAYRSMYGDKHSACRLGARLARQHHRESGDSTALGYLREAEAIRRARPGPVDPELARIYHSQATWQLTQQDWRGTVATCERGLAAATCRSNVSGLIPSRDSSTRCACARWRWARTRPGSRSRATRWITPWSRSRSTPRASAMRGSRAFVRAHHAGSRRRGVERGGRGAGELARTRAGFGTHAERPVRTAPAGERVGSARPALRTRAERKF